MSWQPRRSSLQTLPWTSWRTPQSIPLRCSGVGPVLSSVWLWGSTNDVWISSKVLDVKTKTKANHFFLFSKLTFLFERSAISLICDPILYSFILSVVPVSLSGMVPDQENFIAKSLLSKFAFDIPKSHPWPHWMEDQQGGECATWLRWQEGQSATASPCHTACVPCGAEGILNYTAAIPKPGYHLQSCRLLLCQLIEKCQASFHSGAFREELKGAMLTVKL